MVQNVFCTWDLEDTSDPIHRTYFRTYTLLNLYTISKRYINISWVHNSTFASNSNSIGMSVIWTQSGCQEQRSTEPQAIRISIRMQEACLLCRENISCCTNRKSHVGEKHNCYSGSGSLRESRSLMAEVSRGTTSWGKTRSLQKHRLLGRRVKQDCEIKLCLFSTLSLPLSICLSLPFSLSLCLFSLCKPSAANFHPTLLSSSVKISSLLTSPTPWQWAHFIPQIVCPTIPDVVICSDIFVYAISLCHRGPVENAGDQLCRGQPCNSSVRLRHKGLEGRRDRGYHKLPLLQATSSLHWDSALQTPE